MSIDMLNGGDLVTERCVICAATVRPKDSGLCDDHKYDEQLRPTLDTNKRRMVAVTVIISEPFDSPEIDWPAYVAATLRLDFNNYSEHGGTTVVTSWRADS